MAETVDTAGSAVLRNDTGLTAHIFFGMDDTYRCELEVWGSRASLVASRIFTAPPDLSPELLIRNGNGCRTLYVEQDDQFYHSISKFATLIEKPNERERHCAQILKQSVLIEQIRAQYVKGC